MIRLAISAFLLVLIVACNEPTRPAEKIDTVFPPDTITTHDLSDINHSCCFTSEEDFLPFFPDSSADFRFDNEARVTNLKCISDTMLASQSVRGYLDSDGKTVTVGIDDYCAVGPALLDSDYVHMMRAYRDDKTVTEYNEFEMPGLYHGFVSYQKGIKLAIVTLVVDQRFMVEIVAQQATGSRSVMKMLDYIPVKSLAAWNK